MSLASSVTDGLSSAGAWASTQTRSVLPSVRGAQHCVFELPLVMMNLTREAAATSTVGEFAASPNQFGVMTHDPDASCQELVRTGNTLLATAWLDVRDEPYVLSVPDTDGRYYLIALFDLWSNDFVSIGKRTTGTARSNFLMAGHGWRGEKPAHVDDVYRSPSSYVCVNGQMQADGPDECATVTSLRRQYRLTPLRKCGMDWNPTASVDVLPSADSTAPFERVPSMDAQTYFGRLTDPKKDNPPHVADRKAVSTMRKLGQQVGRDFEMSSMDLASSLGLARSMGACRLLQLALKLSKTKDGWIVSPDNVADWGTDYPTRSRIAVMALGGILPIDVPFPTAVQDGAGRVLDGSDRYLLHFDEDPLPSARATWPVGMYDADGDHIPSALDHYHIAPWMPLTYNPDGSLEVYLQVTSPSTEKESNWLPAPSSSSFSVTVCVYWPAELAPHGKCMPPPIPV